MGLEKEIELVKDNNLLFINSRRFIEFIVSIINNYDNISEVDFDNEEKLMLNMMYKDKQN